MKVIFRERKRKKSKHKSLYQVLKKTLDYFLEPDIMKKLNVEVYLGRLEDDDFGRIYDLNNKYTKFRIEIDNTSPIWRMRQSIRHEAIHLKQFVLGELRFINNPYSTYEFINLWKGNYYNLDFWDQPWEIEAYYYENYRF